MAIAIPCHGATVGSGPFELQSFFPALTPTFNVEPGSVGGFCDPFTGIGCDASVNDGSGNSAFVDWVSGNAFDLGIFSSASVKPISFALDIGNVRSTDDKPIETLTFNFGGGTPLNDLNIDGFVKSADNPSAPDLPTVITEIRADEDRALVFLQNVSPLLWADGVTFRFDVTFAADQEPGGGGGTDPMSVIPLPAGGVLLLSALGLFAGLRRRGRDRI
ncbi:MAG: VPLPA-CTERM sorting domain-containing protein [Pseudomonadota bacterium]